MKFPILIPLLLIFQACATTATVNNVGVTKNSMGNGSELNNINGLKSLNENSEKDKDDAYYDLNGSLGLVSANAKRYEQNSSIRIFNQDGSLWYELSSKDENEEGVITVQKKEFMPFRVNADELLVVMNSVGEDDRYYHVIVNEETQLKKFVQKSDLILKLGTWEKYILDCFAVGFDSRNNPLRVETNGLPIEDDVPERLRFRPEEIKGEWLKVRWNDNDDDKQKPRYGWVRWKENQKMVLHLFEIA